MARPEARPSHFVLGDRLRSASLEDHLKYCLRAAILTHVGERELAPELGSEVRELLFRPLVPGLRVELEGSLRKAIAAGEPRVEVESVDIGRDPSDAARVLVNLAYRVLETRKRDQVKVRL